MRLKIEFVDRLGIAQEILAVLAGRGLDVIAVEVDPPHIYLEAPALLPADLAGVRGAIDKLGMNDVQVQNFGSARDVLIRLPVQKGVTSAQQSNQVMAALQAVDASAAMRRAEFVGPQVGDELAADGLKALAFGLLCLLPVGVLAAGAGGGAGGAGLLGQ